MEERFLIEPDELIIRSIAHMRPFNHPEVIVQACALLTKREVKVRVLMAGGGEMRQEMEDLSRKLGGQRAHSLAGKRCQPGEISAGQRRIRAGLCGRGVWHGLG